MFPKFCPNEYMYKTFSKNHKEKWEVFAWAVQDMFQTRFDLPDNPQPNREKVNY